MTDHIPADKVREIVEKMYHHANHDNVRGTEEEYVRFFARQIDELLPAPPRPTLADMTEAERAECAWMQADVEHRGRAVVIVPEWGAGHAELLDRRGNVFYAAHDRVAPRPDLPSLTWPGEQQPAPAPALPDGWRLADHREHGRVIVTRPAPDRNGNVPYMFPSDDSPLRRTWHFAFPDALTYLDQGADQ